MCVWVDGWICEYEGSALTYSFCLAGSAAAVWPHPQSAADHVHSGLLPVPHSSATGSGNPHQI